MGVETAAPAGLGADLAQRLQFAGIVEKLLSSLHESFLAACSARELAGSHVVEVDEAAARCDQWKDFAVDRLDPVRKPDVVDRDRGDHCLELPQPCRPAGRHQIAM